MDAEDELQNEQDENYVINSPEQQKVDNNEYEENQNEDEQINNQEEPEEINQDQDQQNDDQQQQDNNVQINQDDDNQNQEQIQEQEQEEVKQEEKEKENSPPKSARNRNRRFKKRNQLQSQEEDEQSLNNQQEESKSPETGSSHKSSMVSDSDEHVEKKQREQEEKFKNNKSKFNMIDGQQIKDQPLFEKKEVSQSKQIKDYILKDFQEIQVVYKQELEKFKKETQEDQIKYEKKKNANFSGESLLKITKEPKNTSGIIEFFTNTSTRYIFFENNTMYMLRKVKGDEYKVKSINKLENLFKIYAERNSKNVTMAFYNNQLNHNIPPKHKKFTVKDVQAFLSLVKSEVTTLAYDLVYK